MKTVLTAVVCLVLCGCGDWISFIDIPVSSPQQDPIPPQTTPVIQPVVEKKVETTPNVATEVVDRLAPAFDGLESELRVNNEVLGKILEAVTPKSKEVKEEKTLKLVMVYAPSWCPVCTPGVLAIEKEGKNNGVVEFCIERNVDSFPQWLQQKPSWNSPVLVWDDPTSPTGKRTTTGWPGLQPFLELMRRSKGVATTLPIRSLATDDAAHTPMSEVVRVIGLLPKPEVAFVDFGCGYDARWCIAAAERWGCKCIGIEIDSDRANAARERVRNLGLDNLITILEGDAGEVPVTGDVAVVYLYSSLLARLKPRLESFKVVASYLHQPPGMPCEKNGDTWIYRKQVQMSSIPQGSGAVWQGMMYNQPVCNSPNCAMCNAIRRQLGYR